MEIKRAYSTDGFCDAFGIGKTTLYEKLGSGEIVARKVDGQHPHSARRRRTLAGFVADLQRRQAAGGPGRGHSKAA